MKTKVAALGLIFLGTISCQSQDLKNESKVDGNIKPQERAFVNKQYDDQGNLIALDSVRTYYYSIMEGDSLSADSLMNEFRLYFNNHFPEMADHQFFENDTNYLSEFMNHNFFEQQFMMQDKEMLNMMRAMDSVKNKYFELIDRQYGKLN